MRPWHGQIRGMDSPHTPTIVDQVTAEAMEVVAAFEFWAASFDQPPTVELAALWLHALAMDDAADWSEGAISSLLASVASHPGGDAA